jgi:hypothetical protein
MENNVLHIGVLALGSDFFLIRIVLNVGVLIILEEQRFKIA